MRTSNIFYRFFILSIFCVIAFSCQKKVTDPAIVRSSKYKKSIVEAYQKLAVFKTINYIPGLTVAVSIDNQTIWADGFGYSNVELKTKASPTHKFRIGQVSEVITALTTAKLSEEGKFSFDQPVSEILPELSTKTSNYSIYQLGTHSSGLRAESEPAGKGSSKSLDELIPTFVNEDMLYETGAGVSHSELGYDLIGYLIQKTTNQTFDKAVKKTLLDTLKMANTSPDHPYVIVDDKANTYDYDFLAQPITAEHLDLRAKVASAGYLSSVADLVKLGNSLIYPGFLKQETLTRITSQFTTKSGQKSQFGFGVIVSKDNDGNTFIGQQGKVNGGVCALLIYPDDKLVVAISANIGNNSWELPIFETASIFQKALHPEKARPAVQNNQQKATPSTSDDQK